MRVRHLVCGLALGLYLYGLYVMIFTPFFSHTNLKGIESFGQLFNFGAVLYTVIVVLYFLIDLIQKNWNKKIL